jgi:poly(hydroxyalkanoate) depolymerase family esterase
LETDLKHSIHTEIDNQNGETAATQPHTKPDSKKPTSSGNVSNQKITTKGTPHAALEEKQRTLHGKKVPELLRVKDATWQQYLYHDATGKHPYFAYTPSTYHRGTAVPLLVLLHGCTQKAADFAIGTGMNQLAEQYGFIALYPQQKRTSNQTLCWNWFKSSHQFRDRGEPALIAHRVQAICSNTSQWTIDSSRVYVVGASAGAAMAVILGATYPDIFAAIGVHSGVEYQAVTNIVGGLKLLLGGGPDPVKQGQKAFEAMGSYKRMKPTIVFQGTRDRIVPPINGDQVVQQWIQTNHLASHGLYVADFNNPATTTSGQVPEGLAYTVSTWEDRSGKEVQQYWKIDGLAHAWSGGNPAVSYTDPRGPNASEVMYQFFMKHTMAEASRYEASPRKSIRQIMSNFLGRLKRKRKTHSDDPITHSH